MSDIIDIVVQETIDVVDITVNPNIIEVNVTRTSGGGAGSQTLAQTLDLGNQTGGKNILVNNADAIEFENGSYIAKGTDEGTGGNGGIEQTCSIGYKWKWEAGEIFIRNQSEQITRKENARYAPTVNDDDTKNFIVNAFWEMYDGTLYICIDNTTGAAAWEIYISTVPNLTQVLTEGGRLIKEWDSADGDYVFELEDLGKHLYFIGDGVGGDISVAIPDNLFPMLKGVELQGSVKYGTNITLVYNESSPKTVIINSNNIDSFVRFNANQTENNIWSVGLSNDILENVPTTTSQLTNDGADGVNPFITALDIPTTGQASTLVREVKNMTGATLTKGTVVFISGANGNKALVSKAIATTDALSARTFGLLQSDILNNGTGNCVIIGDLSGLDTSSFAEGAQLYLSGVTAGTYTSTRTLAPTHLVYVGKVTRSHPTQGQIEVQIQNGYELEEIHDCQIISPTNNQALIYETSTDLWKNKTVDKTFVGLGNVDNTSDVNKPVSAAQTTAINAKVSDAIVDGVTTVAPSQNAVFDALALKQDSLGYTPVKTVVKDTAVSSSVTGTTTETILKSYTIAGGTFAANDMINLVSARFTKTGTAGNSSTFKMYINTTNSLSGAVQIAQLSGTGLYYKFSRTFALRGGSLLGFSFTANGTQSGSDMGNSSVTQSTTTLNPANTFYIIFTGTNAISTDSIFSSEIYITN